jgi:hypothetical protein
VIDLWANFNNWYQSEVENLKIRLPWGGYCYCLEAADHRSAKRPGGDDEHAIVGEAADDFLLAKQHGVATWRCRREDDGRG